MFKKVNPKQNFPEMEKEILKQWQKDKIFEKSVEKGGERKTYSFFDGPPFATGLPHYGHIVASLIKDVAPRFWTMKGYKVERRWGWDCHGLPIENLIEKEHNIKNKQDIEKWGVDKFNEACHASVLRYADEWKKFIPRIGRWVDMENDYQTMDWKYTESIWWVFSELYKKGLVYEGYKAMHICPRCETTLSNFEVTQGYKEITDLSVTAKFKLKAGQKIGDFATDNNTYVLAWTTTPWTLPGNAALAANSNIKYLVLSVKGKNGKYILAKERVDEIFRGEESNILSEIEGKELIGLEYEPLFDYYSKKEDLKNKENGWKIYSGDFVSTEEGTGIVHIVPAFGDDDMKMGQKYNLPFIQHVKMNGRFAEEVVDFRDKKVDSQIGSIQENRANNIGREVKPKRNPRETDEKIVKWLEENNKLFTKENYKHSYPHCWRCDTPLLNYATSSWFVKVTKIKDKMIKNNQKINWVPEYIKEGRFGKWLREARDWAISRSRFWGAPLPVWKCEKCKNTEIVGSIDELRNKTSLKITKIVFLRHGESEKNIDSIKSDSIGRFPLTEKGIRHARKAAQDIRNFKIDLIITSPILRAKQTAEIINKELEVDMIENNLVSEYKFGSWNDKSNKHLLENDELYKKYKKIRNLDEKYDFILGGDGESRADVEKRAKKFMDYCAEKYAGKNILVVSHGGLNGALKKVLNNISIKDFFRAENALDYCQSEVFYIDEKGREFDLHKPDIDRIKIKCSKCGGVSKIVGDVFDCWFESGSMPYAQWHYPFENQDKFEKGFPAEFIAEGLDQTRGWFYTMIVLSTALFDKPAFKNVIVNGIVLAEGGQKMSKRLKNYPEPNLLIEKYGADALRYYLLTSSVMKAENLQFSEKGVEEVLKRFILILWNAHSFLVMNANIDFGRRHSRMSPANGIVKPDNLLDKWIISEFNILVGEVNKQMENYDLIRASRPLREFIDKLSNWYIRRSRKRFALEDMDDRNSASKTLYYIMTEYSKLIAPFMPFLAEEIYKNITGKESVHLEEYPKADKDLIDRRINEKMDFVRDIVALGLAIRAKNRLKVRQPLQKLEVKMWKLLDRNSLVERVVEKVFKLEIKDEMLDLIKDELNVKEVEFADEIVEKNGWLYAEDDRIKIGLKIEITDELRSEGLAREIVRHIQVIRKEAKYNRDDLIMIKYSFSECGEDLRKVFDKWGNYIKKECLAKSVDFSDKLNADDFDLVKELKVGNWKLEIGVRKIV